METEDFSISQRGVNPLDIAFGLRPGYSNVQVSGRQVNLTTSFQDISDYDGDLVYPLANEQWEILSTSIDDDFSGGAGMIELIIFYQDDSNVRQLELIELDGTTPVQLSVANGFRFESMIGVDWGTVRGENKGDVICRRTSDGLIRGQISYDTTVITNPNGLNSSMSSHYTVPANTVSVPVKVLTNSQKDNNGTYRAIARLPGTNSFVTVGELATYQSVTTIDLSSAPRPLTTGTDIIIQVRSASAGLDLVALNESFFIEKPIT